MGFIPPPLTPLILLEIIHISGRSRSTVDNLRYCMIDPWSVVMLCYAGAVGYRSNPGYVFYVYRSHGSHPAT